MTTPQTHRQRQRRDQRRYQRKIRRLEQENTAIIQAESDAVARVTACDHEIKQLRYQLAHPRLPVEDVLLGLVRIAEAAAMVVKKAYEQTESV